LSVGETTKAIGEFVRQYIEDNGYSPSYREIAEGTGLISASGVFHHIKILVGLGVIEQREGLPRTLAVNEARFREVVHGKA